MRDRSIPRSRLSTADNRRSRQWHRDGLPSLTRLSPRGGPQRQPSPILFNTPSGCLRHRLRGRCSRAHSYQRLSRHHHQRLSSGARKTFPRWATTPTGIPINGSARRECLERRDSSHPATTTGSARKMAPVCKARQITPPSTRSTPTSGSRSATAAITCRAPTGQVSLNRALGRIARHCAIVADSLPLSWVCPG